MFASFSVRFNVDPLLKQPLPSTRVILEILILGQFTLGSRFIRTLHWRPGRWLSRGAVAGCILRISDWGWLLHPI